MGPKVRRLVLTLHIASSVGWLGAIASFLALAGSGVVVEDPEFVRAVYVVLDPLTRLVIVPVSLVAVLTGLVQSLGTSWGLIRHYWIMVKFVVTVAAFVVLLLQLEPIATLSDIAARDPALLAAHRLERISLVVHSGGGLLVLLVPLVLSVYKPRGLTRWGQRRVRSTATSGAATS